MNTPTYYEQERKIHEAYIKDEVRPYAVEFCFCGTLAPPKYSGLSFTGWESDFYTLADFKRMEHALLKTIDEKTYNNRRIYEGFVFIGNGNDCSHRKAHKNYEEALFNGMISALEVLKQIHESKGEVIDNKPVFVKRQLAKV